MFGQEQTVINITECHRCVITRIFRDHNIQFLVIPAMFRNRLGTGWSLLNVCSIVLVQTFFTVNFKLFISFSRNSLLIFNRISKHNCLLQDAFTVQYILYIYKEHSDGSLDVKFSHVSFHDNYDPKVQPQQVMTPKR